MMEDGYLYYRHRSKSWVFKNYFGAASTLFPEEDLQVKVAGVYNQCSLIFAGDGDWYLLFEDCCFLLKKGAIYSARMLLGDYF